MARVVHFEVSADDPERAIGFYRDVFGWQIDKWAGPTDYWLATTGPDDVLGINGAITPRQGTNGVINTIGVESLEETVAKIAAAGGTVVEPHIDIPGIGALAYFLDTEGNLFCAMQPLMVDSN